METITDPAAIRATDEPDPFRRNPVRRTGPDDPWRFTRFVADDHECVIVRDEYDEPAPFGSCSTHRRALSSPVALGCTTPAPVGAAVALDLDAIEARYAPGAKCSCAWQGGSLYASECAIHDERKVQNRLSHARTDVPALVAEVRRLTESRSTVAANLAASLLRAEAEVVTLRAKLTAVEAVERGLSEGWVMLATVSDRAEFVRTFRAALATTGEGQR